MPKGSYSLKKSDNTMRAWTVAIVDYGVGNIGSVARAFDRKGVQVKIAAFPKEIQTADAIVLPGVGAFGPAHQHLVKNAMDTALTEAVIEKKTPFLGICLGMQLIAESSEENGSYPGLGWIKGTARRLQPKNHLKLPHIGWNELTLRGNTPLFKGLTDLNVYFVHSYHVECDPSRITATCKYGQTITAAIQQDHIMATQFHLENSSENGVKMIENFIEFAKEAA